MAPTAFALMLVDCPTQIFAEEGVVVTESVETFTITWSVIVTVVLLQLVYLTCAV
jgi:hypothetical protein